MTKKPLRSENDRKLLSLIYEQPGISTVALAALVGRTNSSTYTRLYTLRENGYISSRTANAGGSRYAEWVADGPPDTALCCEQDDYASPEKDTTPKQEITASGSRIVRLTNHRHPARDCCGSQSGHWRGASILGGNESVFAF